MATTKKPASNGKPDPADLNIDDVALKIYSGLSPHIPAPLAANTSYRRAAEFIAAAERYRAGGVEVPQESPESKLLDDACAPNLPESHPYNMASRSFGSLEKLKVLKRMSEDPEGHGLSPEDGRLCAEVCRMAESRAGITIDSID